MSIFGIKRTTQRPYEFDDDIHHVVSFEFDDSKSLIVNLNFLVMSVRHVESNSVKVFEVVQVSDQVGLGGWGLVACSCL